MELKADPSALAPERLLVLEVRSSLSAFAGAVKHVPGLELIDEEELGEDDDKAPVAYLVVPDAVALANMESLWQRWKDEKDFDHGLTVWRDVFNQLRDIRPWGPFDRVNAEDAEELEAELAGHLKGGAIRVEIELVYRGDKQTAKALERDVTATVNNLQGSVVDRARIDNIAYHALLVDLPPSAVQSIVERSLDGVAGIEHVMHIRPQSLASRIEAADGDDDPPSRRARKDLGEPILALLDGVPVAAHRRLSSHLDVDDQFELEPEATVSERVHGTAMASLIIHGDLNANEPSLPRRIHAVPVMGKGDEFPPDRLIIDVVNNAILAMRKGPEATAPDVVIINVSLGNSRRPFHRQMSPWARLLDRLAYEYGILFVVSAGNHSGDFGVEAFSKRTQFEDAKADIRARASLKAVSNLMLERRLLSPAETVNGITVGARNTNAGDESDRRYAKVIIEPYPEHRMANPSSALGPGFAGAVKPDFLLPGGREHLTVLGTSPHVRVRPAAVTGATGLRVAMPPTGSREDSEGFTNGTSAAAAIASRTAHRIHDALESAYGEAFLMLSSLQRAVLLKALLAHTATWPEESAALIREVLGPSDPRRHAQQKDNVRRFLGYGLVDTDEAVACAADRATFWSVGELLSDKIAVVDVPIPTAISGKTLPHSISATLAWFTPVSPGRRSYRSVRLKLVDPDELPTLGVKATSDQPDLNQARRGTMFKRLWQGKRAPAVGANMNLRLVVQRDSDQGAAIDEDVPFGLAVTLTMPGVNQIYDEVWARIRLNLRPRVRAT